MDEQQIKDAARRAVEYLCSPEGRAELKRRHEENERYFEWLREATKPKWEDLQRPFDI